MSEQAAFLTDWVLPNVPIRQWVVSFPIQLRYWMARDSDLMGSVLGIVIRSVSSFQRQKGKSQGFSSGESGSVTLVQRFGGSANLNIHFHTLMTEGVFREEDKAVAFHELRPPTNDEVCTVLQRIQSRVVRHLKRKGYAVERKPESNESEYTEEAMEPSLIDLCQGASVQNRIAVGERAGQRVRKLGSFGVDGESVFQEGTRCASLGGFSLHANTSVEATEKDALEKLCRYIARPPIAEMRLYPCSDGGIGYRFKKPWSDGTQAVYFSPLEFIEKLVALIPQPRIHLTRFHGVLAPNHRFRAQIVPEQPEEAPSVMDDDGEPEKVRDPRRLSWSELLKRVFQVDLTTCPDCGGTLHFIAAIMEREVVERILSHLKMSTVPPKFHPPRAPPQEPMFD